MSGNHIPAIVGSTFADVLGGFSLSGTNLVGAGVAASLERLLSNRLESARVIFLDEVRDASRPIRDTLEQDEFVSIFYRYLEAARQGAARLNLRLIAKVARGQFEGEGLYASDFSRYANLITSLSREEVIFLATLHRVAQTASYDCDTVSTYKQVVDALRGTVFQDDAEIRACAAALQRTGLVLPLEIPLVGGMGYNCKPSPLLDKLVRLASFEDALAKEPLRL